MEQFLNDFNVFPTDRIHHATAIETSSSAPNAKPVPLLHC